MSPVHNIKDMSFGKQMTSGTMTGGGVLGVDGGASSNKKLPIFFRKASQSKL
jgi:hypothetical protein